MEKRFIIIEENRKNALNQNRTCFEYGCHSLAIESHLLQKNGIIDRIADDRHVYEFIASTYAEPYHLKFQRRGINKVFTFKGFCHDHDERIFSPIEKNSFDLKNDYNQLLFAYRTLINEIRKKEVALDCYNSLLAETSIPIDKQALYESINGTKMGITDSEQILDIIKESLSNPLNNKFIFYSRILPKIEMCACGVITFETTNEINSLLKDKDLKFFQPLTDVFLTLLPFEDHSVLSIGFINGYNNKCDDYYADLFNKRTDQYMLQILSNILILQCENWITSKTFYFEKIKTREERILKF
jgi:hypothetical protein